MRPKKLIGIACNCPTSLVVEQLADMLGFIVIRGQTGEAMVVDAMERLGRMSWQDAKILSDNNGDQIYIPQCLRQQFGDDHKNDIIDVPKAGEGSNGSDFTPQLLVRDPINTIEALMKFLNPETGKNFVRALLVRQGRDSEWPQWEHSWDDSGTMRGLMSRVIGELLPVTTTTNFFDVGGPGVRTGPPVPLGLIKDHCDTIFENNYWPDVRTQLAAGWGAMENEITHEYINTEDLAKIGSGNRNKIAMPGREIGDGGYKIQFYITRNGVSEPVAWIWFRDSITEAGLTRNGASFAWPISVSGIDRDGQREIAKATYDYLKEKVLNQLLDDAALATQKDLLNPAYTDTTLPPHLAQYSKGWNNARETLIKYLKSEGDPHKLLSAGPPAGPMSSPAPVSSKSALSAV